MVIILWLNLEKLMLLGEGCTTSWQYPVLQAFLFPVLPSVSTLSGSLLLLSLLCRDL